MWWRAVIAGLVVAAVSEIGNRFPRLGALVLTLPIVSIVAFIAFWQKEQDLNGVSRLARETLILVPLGLPFFVPLAFAERLGISFWAAFLFGMLAASVAIGAWLWFSSAGSTSPSA